MIYVRRPGAAADHLLSDDVKKERLSARAHFVRPAPQRSYFRFDLRVLEHADVRAALIDLFHRKCAYCESHLGASSSWKIDHFRPLMDAQNLDRRVSNPDCYWWLALDWKNLYPACQRCALNKGLLFPVVGERGTSVTGIGEEGALLLDPCADRDIDRHLFFEEDGTVAGTKRGAVTIDVFGLNRAELVADRARIAERLLKIWGSVLDANQTFRFRRRQLRELTGAVRPEAYFSALARQLLVRKIDGLPQELEPVLRGDLGRLREGLPELTRRPRERGRSRRRFGYITAVEIRNLRAIGEFNLSLLESPVASAPEDQPLWKVLLGENGCGKSSVLQAVAMALTGFPGKRRWPLEPSKILRRGSRKGFIRLKLSQSVVPLEIHFDREGFVFKGERFDTRFLVRAYGATRLFPRAGQTQKALTGPSRVNNLFDPFSPLCDAAAWLSALDEELFRRAAQTLCDLLGQGVGSREDVDPPGPRSHQRRPVLLRRHGRSVEFRLEGVWLTFDQLSDGYQTVMALACDIMAGVAEGLSDLRHVQGIVLLDEIGAHLHPRWRMEIVGGLRRAFPAMQFIGTTHEPLCLRGLRKSEISVMRRHNGTVVKEDDELLPAPELLRVDQLLTSRHFGLYSTLEPEIDRRFQQYYELLAARSRARELGKDLDAEDASRLQALRDRLSKEGTLGYTRRDQKIYDLIDDYLVREASVRNREQLREIDAQVRKEVVRLWSNILGEGGES